MFNEQSAEEKMENDMNRTSNPLAHQLATRHRSNLIQRLIAAGVGLLLLAACSSETQEPATSSQTHWLKSCDSSDDCEGGLSCECGVCTQSCDDDDRCSALGEGAVCAATEGVAACGSNAAEQICLEGCNEDDDCSTGSTCSNSGACIPSSDDGETPPGVNCGDYDSCDLETPCGDGNNCIAFSECGGALCIPADEACELSCPNPDDCALAESYPEQLFCEGKVDANPADDGTDTDGTGTDGDATDTGTDGDVTDPAAGDPPGVMCADHEPCDLDTQCADGTSCYSFPECGGAICVADDEACEQSCPEQSECEILESYPLQLACDGQVPAQPGEPGQDPTPTDGIQCAEHPVCDPAGDGCEAGLECLIIPECGSDETGHAICIDTDLACELSCPNDECVILESYPAQLGCSGERIPATPAPGGNPDVDAGAPSSEEFACDDYQECAADIDIACPDGSICVTLPECGDDLAYGVCVPPDVACEVRCPEGASCTQQESYPVQIACGDTTDPACSPETCPDGQTMNQETCVCENTPGTEPAGVACGEYDACSLESSTCPTNADCIAIDGCDSAICIPADEACELSCPNADECVLMESFPLQIGCPGIVPGMQDMTPDGELDLALLGTACVDNACPDGLTALTYFGIAGPSGPEFCSCEIPCVDTADVCPTGTSCQTIADGPGEVCVRTE